jgi:3-isopropylmalate dehydrogenase
MIVSPSLLAPQSGEAHSSGENAVKKVLKSGLRTGDIWQPGCQRVGTREMDDAVLRAL